MAQRFGDMTSLLKVIKGGQKGGQTHLKRVQYL
jgi:hypothetical protein